MLPTYEWSPEATPEKGAIVVEYYWEHPIAIASELIGGAASLTKSNGKRELPPGTKTSKIFFKRILAADKCWCGSKRAFSRCHRRPDDWSFITLNTDLKEYSAVVLLEQTTADLFDHNARMRIMSADDIHLLESTPGRTLLGVASRPANVNELGTLIFGTVTIGPGMLHVETNSENRLAYIRTRLEEILGTQMGWSEVRRAEPQTSFSLT